LDETSEIRIIGIDEKRPPKIRKEPYIDLFFQLSRQAPKDWCEDFNLLAKGLVPTVKIDINAGLFIDAYVRGIDDIPAHFDNIKKKIQACNERYSERIRQQALAEAATMSSLRAAGGEQARLNSVIASLNYDD